MAQGPPLKELTAMKQQSFIALLPSKSLPVQNSEACQPASASLLKVERPTLGVLAMRQRAASTPIVVGPVDPARLPSAEAANPQ